MFYQITKTSSQIRTLIPKVNFTHCETHSLRNAGGVTQSHQFRCISSVLTKSRKPPCLSNSFEMFYPITKTSFQIRTLIPKVNFTYRETHSLQNAREVTQFHQSQVESHNIRYDSPTKQSGMKSNLDFDIPLRVDDTHRRVPRALTPQVLAPHSVRLPSGQSFPVTPDRSVLSGR